VKRITTLIHHTLFMQIAVEVIDEEASLALKYRMALSDWSLARFHHRSDSPEVLEAAQTLERMEDAFRMLRGTYVVKYHPRPPLKEMF
jgi:hypothetical protein